MLSDPSDGILPEDLIYAMRNIYGEAGLNVTSAPQREAESAEYGACQLGLNGQTVVFRVGKTTPTKIGQFLTTWKRSNQKIIPFDICDGIDFLVVNCSEEAISGQFVFDQDILIEQGIMSNKEQPGKTAFRIYPPWTTPVANAAIKTQKWQLRYFFAIESNRGVNLDLVRRLFKT